jgi:hypothetical protein
MLDSTPPTPPRVVKPTVDVALSVQVPTQFSKDRFFVSRYEDKTLNISWTLLVPGTSLQQKMRFL